MYNYSDLARAEIVAAEVISRNNNIAIAFSLSDTYAANVEFMHKLAIVDTLELNWRSGRYLSFICALRNIRRIYLEFFKNQQNNLWFSMLNDESFESIKIMSEYEDTLFEYMSCRSDASFSVNRDLYVLTRLECTMENVDIELCNLISRMLGRDDPLLNDNFCPDTLLTKMAEYIESADWLTEIMKTEDTPATRELYAIFKNAGLYDRWRKF